MSRIVLVESIPDDVPVRRYEHCAPGDLVHVDSKKLGRIPDGGGWRVHGRAVGARHARATTTVRKHSHPVIGYQYLHRPGLLLALEPWVMADTAKLAIDADGWTLRSATGCRTAHSEHTIAITNHGADILTMPSQTQP